MQVPQVMEPERSIKAGCLDCRVPGTPLVGLLPRGAVRAQEDQIARVLACRKAGKERLPFLAEDDVPRPPAFGPPHRDGACGRVEVARNHLGEFTVAASGMNCATNEFAEVG